RHAVEVDRQPVSLDRQRPWRGGGRGLLGCWARRGTGRERPQQPEHRRQDQPAREGAGTRHSWWETAAATIIVTDIFTTTHHRATRLGRRAQRREPARHSLRRGPD